MKFILRILLSLTATYAVAQNAITVSLNDVSGTGPFIPGSLITKPNEQQLKGCEVPQNLRYFRYRFFDFQPAQSIYWKYLDDSDVKALEISLKKALDTTVLTKKVFPNKLWILIGVDKLGNTVVIPDANYDLSFKNDKQIIFEPLLNKEEQAKRIKVSPTEEIEFFYFDGKQVQRRKTLVRFNTYLGNLSVSRKTKKDSIDESLFLQVGIYSHKEGTFMQNDQTYQVAVSNGFTSWSYKRTNSRFNFAEFSHPFRSQVDGYKPYKIGEIATINDHLFRIDSISTDGTKLMLSDQGTDAKHAGHDEGEFLPVFHGLTVTNSEIDLADFRGKYLFIDFWGTWCAPCIEALPKVAHLKDKYADRPFEVIGVAYDNDSSKVLDFISRRNISWKQIFQDRRDPLKSTLVNVLKVDQFPTTLLVGTDGKILLRNKTFQEVEKMLDSLLGN